MLESSKNLTAKPSIGAKQGNNAFVDKYLNKQSVASNLERFEGLGAIYVGNKPTIYYPKKKDRYGKKIQKDGKDVLEEQSTGYLYTFVELGTAMKIKVVLPKEVNVFVQGVYEISGNGYKFGQESYFLQENGGIKDAN